jgi:hypothetical protein
MVPTKVVNVAVLAALVLGIGLYNIVPLSSDDERQTAPAVVASTTTTTAIAASGDDAGAAAAVPTGGAFGSAVAALEQGLDAGSVGGSGEGGSTLPPTPPPPPIPASTCPTDVANDAYESVSGPVGAALGQPLPEDNLRVLAEIAAGCSAEPATTPLIGLALDISRLVPDTGIGPVDLSAIPAVDAPALPGALVDALAPISAPIQEACGGVGLLGVLVAVLPGAANVPVHGQDLADALVPAQSLCAQLEG